MGYQPKIAEETKQSGALKARVFFDYINAGAGLFSLVVIVVIMVISQGEIHAPVTCLTSLAVLFHGCDFWLSIWTNDEQRYAAEQRECYKYYNLTLKDEFASEANMTHPCPPSPVDKLHNIYIYTGLIIALYGSTLLRTMLFFVMCMRSSVNLHNTIFYKVLRSPMGLFDNK